MSSTYGHLKPLPGHLRSVLYYHPPHQPAIMTPPDPWPPQFQPTFMIRHIADSLWQFFMAHQNPEWTYPPCRTRGLQNQDLCLWPWRQICNMVWSHRLHWMWHFCPPTFGLAEGFWHSRPQTYFVYIKNCWCWKRNSNMVYCKMRKFRWDKFSLISQKFSLI